MHGLNDPLMDLDLTSAQVKEGISLLTPGRHVCMTRHAEIKTTPKQRSLNVVLEAIDGSGIITARLNVWAQNSDAMTIARDQLKTLCTFGKHPNPNQPLRAGLQSLVALPVGVVVKNGKPYEKDGRQIVGVEVSGFFQLDDAEFAAAKATPGTYKAGQRSGGGGGLPGSLNDDIPFAPCM